MPLVVPMTLPPKVEEECARNARAVMENSYVTVKIQDVWGLLAVAGGAGRQPEYLVSTHRESVEQRRRFMYKLQ